MFRYADGVDKLLMIFGFLGSIGDGLQHPLTMYVLSSVIDEYGKPGASLSMETVNKVNLCFYRFSDMFFSSFFLPADTVLNSSMLQYAFRLLYVALLVGISAFIGKMRFKPC